MTVDAGSASPLVISRMVYATLDMVECKGFYVENAVSGSLQVETILISIVMQEILLSKYAQLGQV
jgi:hypothetical protein